MSTRPAASATTSTAAALAWTQQRIEEVPGVEWTTPTEFDCSPGGRRPLPAALGYRASHNEFYLRFVDATDAESYETWWAEMLALANDDEVRCSSGSLVVHYAGPTTATRNGDLTSLTSMSRMAGEDFKTTSETHRVCGNVIVVTFDGDAPPHCVRLPPPTEGSVS